MQHILQYSQLLQRKTHLGNWKCHLGMVEQIIMVGETVWTSSNDCIKVCCVFNTDNLNNRELLRINLLLVLLNCELIFQVWDKSIWTRKNPFHNQMLKKHEHRICALAIMRRKGQSTDNPSLVWSGSFDRSICIWNTMVCWLWVNWIRNYIFACFSIGSKSNSHLV